MARKRTGLSMTMAPKVLISLNEIIKKLPEPYQWACQLTDDSLADIPAVFNIFVYSENERVNLREYLKLGRPDEEDDRSEYHNYSDELTVGIIEI